MEQVFKAISKHTEDENVMGNWQQSYQKEILLDWPDLLLQREVLLWTKEEQWISFTLTLAKLSTVSLSIQINQVRDMDWMGGI